MLDTLFILFTTALFFLVITGSFAVFFVVVLELFRNKRHAFKHHPTKDCVTC